MRGSVPHKKFAEALRQNFGVMASFLLGHDGGSSRTTIAARDIDRPALPLPEFRRIGQLPARLLGNGNAGCDLPLFLAGDESHCQRLFRLLSGPLSMMRQRYGETLVNFDVVQRAERPCKVLRMLVNRLRSRVCLWLSNMPAKNSQA